MYSRERIGYIWPKWQSRPLACTHIEKVGAGLAAWKFRQANGGSLQHCGSSIEMLHSLRVLTLLEREFAMMMVIDSFRLRMDKVAHHVELGIGDV